MTVKELCIALAGEDRDVTEVLQQLKKVSSVPIHVEHLAFEHLKEGIMRTISLPLGSSLALGVLLAVLITGLFDHYYWSLHGGIVVFWASIGAALCLLYGGEKPTGDVDK